MILCMKRTQYFTFFFNISFNFFFLLVFESGGVPYIRVYYLDEQWVKCHKILSNNLSKFSEMIPFFLRGNKFPHLLGACQNTLLRKRRLFYPLWGEATFHLCVWGQEKTLSCWAFSLTSHFQTYSMESGGFGCPILTSVCKQRKKPCNSLGCTWQARSWGEDALSLGKESLCFQSSLWWGGW